MESLKDAVNSGKEHARAALAAAKGEWESLNVEVPKMVGDIQTRVDKLSKDKIHISVTKDELASAKTGLEWMKSELNDAVAASNSKISPPKVRTSALTSQATTEPPHPWRGIDGLD